MKKNRIIVLAIILIIGIIIAFLVFNNKPKDKNNNSNNDNTQLENEISKDIKDFNIEYIYMNTENRKIYLYDNLVDFLNQFKNMDCKYYVPTDLDEDVEFIKQLNGVGPMYRNDKNEFSVVCENDNTLALIYNNFDIYLESTNDNTNILYKNKKINKLSITIDTCDKAELVLDKATINLSGAVDDSTTYTDITSKLGEINKWEVISFPNTIKMKYYTKDYDLTLMTSGDSFEDVKKKKHLMFTDIEIEYK